MVQQTKKIPPPVPPKNMEQLLDTYESANPFPNTLTKEEIMRVIAKAYGPPPKPQKPEKLQSFRIDRLESKIDEIGQMTSKFGRISLNDQSRKPFYCSNCGQEGHKKNNCLRLNPVAKSNFTQCYYPQLPSTQPQYTPPDSDNEEDGYDKVENGWYYMVGVSSGVNDATINALGWKADKPLDFTIKDNSKHITESLRWFTDVPVSINFVKYDMDSKSSSKAPVAKDSSKEDQDQVTTNSSNLTSVEVRRTEDRPQKRDTMALRTTDLNNERGIFLDLGFSLGYKWNACLDLDFDKWDTCLDLDFGLDYKWTHFKSVWTWISAWAMKGTRMWTFVELVEVSENKIKQMEEMYNAAMKGTPAWTWISAWAMKVNYEDACLDLVFSLGYEGDTFLNPNFSLDYERDVSLNFVLFKWHLKFYKVN
ncbi:hypothetical protein GLOIN_2v1481897 [Rhizophagus irregularis DAOM 181602=DAOM 197198]|nr:hypothetical protein GLOIN_2v1481897 [Rhizophagus irregularis DAOM 181602=DAOM 197198]